MKENILIVGGTGFIGINLIKYFSKKFNITSVSTKKPKQPIKNVNYIICDIVKKNEIKSKLKPIYNYVINLGGYVDHSNKKKTFKSHYLGCKNLANFFSNHKIKKFIQIGSSLEYGDVKSPQKETSKCRPKSNYGKAKFLATKYLLNLYKKKKFPCVILRLYQIYGPYQKFNRLIPISIKACVKNKSFACTSGVQKRDFLFIKDFIYIIQSIIYNEKINGEIFNIGSSKSTSVKNLILLIKEISKGGKPLFGKIKMRRDEIKIMYPNIIKAKKLLKWRPIFSLKKGMSETIKHYKKKL